MSRFTIHLALLGLLLPTVADGQLFRGRNNFRPNPQQPSARANTQGQNPQVAEPPQAQTGGTSGANSSATQFQQVRQPYAPKLHWSQALSDKREHDFGAVPKASKQEHVFTFVNTLDSDLHLTHVRTSCGCTKPSIVTSVVKPGETAKVLAKFDTWNFEGQRGATLTVSLQKQSPYRESAEIQFSVRGMIRRDVVLNPGAVDFGNILVGDSANTKIQVKYAGNPNWEITQVRSSNSHITGKLIETRRDVNARRIDYDLEVIVDEQLPPGTFNDELVLVTNDASNQLVKVSLTGLVKQAIQASPLQLGHVTFGSQIEKPLILKGERPFEIVEIRHSSPRLTFDQPEGNKPLHLLKFKFDATLEGPVDDKIVIVTTDPDQPEITVPFSAVVNANPAAESTFAQGKK